MNRKIPKYAGVALVCLGALTVILGVYGISEYGKAVYDYKNTPHNPGSSVPYPALDPAYWYLESSAALFAAGGTILIIWRKKQ